MKKRSLIPETRVKNPEPKKYNEDWIIWAGWADRITFEEIEKKTGKNESQVINCLLYTSPSPRDATLSRMPSSA